MRAKREVINCRESIHAPGSPWNQIHLRFRNALTAYMCVLEYIYLGGKTAIKASPKPNSTYRTAFQELEASEQFDHENYHVTLRAGNNVCFATHIFRLIHKQYRYRNAYEIRRQVRIFSIIAIVVGSFFKSFMSSADAVAKIYLYLTRKTFQNVRNIKGKLFGTCGIFCLDRNPKSHNF